MFKKFNWGHGIVLALGLFISFILFMIFIFPNGKQNSEMVSDNYYEDELQYQQVIDAKKNSDLLAKKPIYTQTSSGINVSFPEEILPQNNKVNFVLFRTNDANLDIKKELNLDADHSFTIPKKILVKGSYTLKLKWKINNKDYQTDYDVLWK